ncbi:MAG TPA: GMC family oxidoreductase N-terminal domain-containing protein [Solirubrobacteraceae bacterium]|jgi:choline dehydrogenase|nr:GMC family oxidoreductase N-terminal domain-containing protein [Solirubrobacteraceae bacterium]
MYDYVIVGAGSAGCVLAARLSEDPDVRVLLLESGPPDVNENIHVPLGYLKLGSTEVDWDYHSAPEHECNDRRITLPRGRVLGGSSSINAMVYIRGNRRDYDEWGVVGWSAADLLPYFIKAEDNERGASQWHGAGGPLPVSEERSHNRISRAFVDAGEQAGLVRNDDFNGAEQDGVGMYQVTQRGGMRASTAVAYLHPASERPNLDVMPYMHVRRVLFDGTRAVGVEASRLGELQQLRAEREVILCGGSYNSPQLLMLSGIGPAEHLTMREVEVLLDQPAVGENLSDHAAAQLVWTTPEPESLLLALEPGALEQYEATQTGPFASNLAEAGGFARVGSDAPAPDTQFHVAPVQIVEEGMRDPEAHGVWASPCLLTPHSRGSVRLASNDPTAKPIVHNAFYTAGDDMQRMIAGLRLLLEICGQPAMKPYAQTPFNTPSGDSDEALRAHVARTTFAIYHPVGTCRMGADATAVVDAELRVNGVEGLRVVDASAMPTVPRGNTNAPTIALAERAADVIRHGRALAEPMAAASTSAARDPSQPVTA